MRLEGELRESKRRDKVLVGVDPGATTGLAILTLDADPLLLTSIRDVSRESLISEILERGEPVLFATDVTPAPASIIKLASQFDSVLYQPERRLGQQEKRSIVQEYLNSRGLKPLDDHCHDALAAALKAYRSYKNKFAKVEARMARLDPSAFKDELKTDLIRGVSLSKALKAVITPIKKKPPSQPRITPDEEALRKESQALREAVMEKERLIGQLLKEKKKLKTEIRELRGETSRLSLSLERLKAEEGEKARRERIYRNQRRELIRLRENLRTAEQKVDSLVQKVRRMRALRESGRSGDLILLKTIRSFTKKGIEEAIVEMNIKEGDPLLIYDASGGGASTARSLTEIRPRFIVTRTKMSHQAEEVLRDNGIKIFDSTTRLYEVEAIPAVKAQDIK